uniref:Uncharacterized protein n=1 Tax=Nicotiana tabacum TaxID=4097 RepID=A0A1S3YI68_TOBAC|nr:PREDICTED: uncharacterized protein LOC107776526 [Nicotiana tabacum]
MDIYYNFVNDKDALIIELRDAEQSRDDLMVVVDDLKEIIETLSKEKNTLVEKIAATEQERDDMVVSIVDLRKQVEEVTREHSLLKNKQKNGWTTLRERKWLERLNLSLRGTMEGSSQQWHMDSDCSKLITGRTNDFLSLKALHGGSVSFEYGKKGYILGVGRIGNSMIPLNSRVPGPLRDSAGTEDETPTDIEEPGPSITISEVENRVVDAPKNIKEALEDADWITAMQEELRQLERNRLAEKDATDDNSKQIEKKKKETWLLWDRKGSVSEELGSLQKQKVEPLGLEGEDVEVSNGASDEDEEDDNDEVTFRDVQRNLKTYSLKKLMSLANVIMDIYYDFVNDKDALIIEIRDAEQSRDDLMVVVDDLKEIIETLSKEKNTLVEKIASTKQERDDMVVSIVDLRKQVEEVTREHSLLKNKQKNGWTTLRERKWLERLNLSLRVS